MNRLGFGQAAPVQLAHLRVSPRGSSRFWKPSPFSQLRLNLRQFFGILGFCWKRNCAEFGFELLILTQFLEPCGYECAIFGGSPAKVGVARDTRQLLNPVANRFGKMP